jgi:membrane-associated phospholipid phosphatase
MEAVSLFAVTYLIITVALIYWCINKRSGIYILSSYTFAVAFNAVLKLTVCAYRPWIRDPRIIPAGDAITTATGYSFPSGHTITATPIYGGIAVSVWKKMKWIAIVCIVLIAVTGISRNYLGVHTPQDVVVALIEGAVFLFAMHKILKYLEKNPGKENIFLIAGIILGIIAICYVTFKSYPMDYVDGKLLVDPQRMMKDGYGDVGWFMGFCVGRFIEKTWVKFEAKLTKETIATGIVGSLILFFLIQLLGSPLKNLLGLQWGSFANNFILIIFITSLWPLVLKLVQKRTGNR